MWVPPALCSSPSLPTASSPLVPRRLLQSLSLSPVIYHRGEVSIPWRIWIVPADFPLERGSSPFVFQSGLRTRSAGCQLDSRHPGSLPHGLSTSSSLFSSFPLLPPLFFFSFPLPSPPPWWKSRSDFPGLPKGEQDQGAAAPPPISAFPILRRVETPPQGNGVSDWFRLSCARNGGNPAAVNKLTLFPPTAARCHRLGCGWGV